MPPMGPGPPGVPGPPAAADAAVLRFRRAFVGLEDSENSDAAINVDILAGYSWTNRARRRAAWVVLKRLRCTYVRVFIRQTVYYENTYKLTHTKVHTLNKPREMQGRQNITETLKKNFFFLRSRRREGRR